MSSLETMELARDYGGWWSISPHHARELARRLDDGRADWMSLGADGATVLTIPKPFRPPQVGDGSPWGRIEGTKEVSNQLVLLVAAAGAGLWLGWDRVKQLPEHDGEGHGYTPWTGHWSWASEQEAPLLLSFFLTDGPVQRMAHDVLRSGTSRNEDGRRFLLFDSYTELLARAAELGAIAQRDRMVEAIRQHRAEAKMLHVMRFAQQ